MAGLSFRPYEKMVDQVNAQKTKDVEFLSCIDAGQETSGVKRQKLFDKATGDYIAFVDDDDQIAQDYVKKILSAIEMSPDVITFKLRERKEVWKFGLYEDNRKKGLMSANHLCAWRRSIASQIAWCPGLGYADDQLWYKPLIASRLARKEIHLDNVLYHYLYSPALTENQTVERIKFAKEYVGKGLKCWHLEDGIYVQTPSGLVRGPNNQLVERPFRSPFYTVKIQ